MTQPTRGDIHVNRPLTNISIAFIQSAADFVADKVFPPVPVLKQSDRFFSYKKKQWFRANAKKRAPSTESAGGGFDIDNTPSYFADVFAIHKDVSDQLRANQDQPIDLDRDAAMYTTQQLMLKKEKEFASKFLTTGIWKGSTTGSDIVPGTKWDAAGSDPVSDVRIQKKAVKKRTSFMPNVLVVNSEVDSALKDNATIIDRVKHTQLGSITNDLLATLFEVDKYLVADAIEDLAGEGLAENMEFIFSAKGALLAYSNPNPSILTPSAGYIFTWQGLFGAGREGSRVKRFRIETLESDRIEGEMAWDQKLIAEDLGVFFNNVLT